MKHASEYRAYAEECRTLAKQMEGEHRELLLDMARTWDKLAAESADLVNFRSELELARRDGEDVSRRRRLEPEVRPEGEHPVG